MGSIINAFCHRDYREFDTVNIAIFKDRVEIRCPGQLYGGLTIDTIRKKMVSARILELEEKDTKGLVGQEEGNSKK